MVARDQRLDFIYTKNIKDVSIKDVKVLWDQEFPGLGYLSDHAGLLAETDIEKRYKA